MKLNTYLKFDGDCRAAFEFYARLLGGRITAMSTFGEAPACDHVAPAARDRIMHARLEAGDQVLMGTDATPEYPYHGVVGAHVVLDVEQPEQAERVFASLSEDGHVEMPIGETFWARRYGIVVDRYGVPWMVNCSLAA
jgi:PhnB protein